MSTPQVDLTQFMQRTPDGAGIPAFALETLQNKFEAVPTDSSGVTQYMGHDKGVAYRFFVHAEFNPIKSKAAKYEKFDEVEMVQWFNDQYNHPTEQVRFLPAELLSVDDYTGEVTGTMAEAYKNFKAGKAAPGTKLRAWGVMSDSDVASMEAARIYTIEQLAAQPEGKFGAKFGKDFDDQRKRAILFVAAKENRIDADRQGAEILDLQKVNAQLLARLESLEAAAVVPADGEKRKPGRPKKVLVETTIQE